MAAILETIKNTISENIRNENAVFVFSTDVACSSWAEWAVKNTGVRALARNRFIAWDNFKEKSTEESTEGQPIPGLLRKIFAENLMVENSKSPIFKKIISPEFSENSSSFTDWVCSVLPSLNSWNALYDGKNKGKVLDEEDADYKLLYERYADFLLNDPNTHKPREEKLYEPAWESKKLLVSNKDYYIFYPEILDDFVDFKDFFNDESISNIHVFYAKDSVDVEKSVEADYFTNSRTEFRKLCLELRHVHETEKIPWREMAVSLPDIDTYLPYIERDLNLYAIPYVVRSGRKVTGINAGSIFTCVKNVYDQDFSYDSMRSLLTNSFVPWKHANLNEELVREGANRKCIINYEKNGKAIDVWDETLKFVMNKQVREWYLVIKRWVKSLSEAKDFKTIRQAWFTGRNELFDFDSLPEDSECNLVLGHCLDKLDNLIRLEEKYNVAVSNPFSFYVNELDNALYQPQTDVAGVNIFKYKVSASAFFEYQFVVDANQANLSVMNSQMKFLNNEKRASLNIKDEDTATESFILLYGKNKGRFSCSQSTVNGFAIPHSRLTTEKDPDDEISEDLKKYDYPSQELSYIKYGSEKPKAVYGMQTQTKENKGFEYYKNVNKTVSEDIQISDSLKKLIKEKAYKEEKVNVTATAMSHYFPCPRKWLFSTVLDLSEDSLTTELFNAFDVGNIYHRVLEKFFAYYYENNKTIPLLNSEGVLPEEEEILLKIKQYLLEVYEETDSRKALSFNRMSSKSILLKEVMDSQVEEIAKFFIPVLRNLCSPYDDKHTNGSGFGNFDVSAIEGKFSDEENSDFRLYGEIDGVLCNQDKLTVIDYKTSRTKGPGDCIINEAEYNPSSKVLPELKDFQLPMYIYLLQKSKLKDVGTLEQALFFSLKKCEKQYIVKEPQMTQKGTKYVYDYSVNASEFQTTVNVFKKYAELYAEEVKACKTFEPDFSKVKDYEHCANCSYNSICRTTYTNRGN
ncbi:MAG: PD-(D/E)XK nuclease family protein [Treponema sp.]|nr:PD-(D/E)XK nuclease family protein [Treponema sp.]